MPPPPPRFVSTAIEGGVDPYQTPPHQFLEPPPPPLLTVPVDPPREWGGGRLTDGIVVGGRGGVSLQCSPLPLLC